jgi:dephospho-CoA kinase
MFVLGLTGSLAMGKSTTARYFIEAGVPLHDADATVHRLYEGEAVAAIEAAFPGTSVDGKIDRQALSRQVVGDKAAMQRLEAIIHPLVRAEEEKFLRAAGDAGAPVVVLDIPLLFEVGADRRVDAVAVVSAPADVQRARALERPGMTEDKFSDLLARQIPDAEKRRRADFVIDTSMGYDAAREQVASVLRSVKAMPSRRQPESKTDSD